MSATVVDAKPRSANRRAAACTRRSAVSRRRRSWRVRAAEVDNGSKIRLLVHRMPAPEEIAMDAHPGRDPFLYLVDAEDPAPLLHRLRAEDPVHFVAPLGFWFVTRHDDVKRLFNDPEHVTQSRRAWGHYAPAPEGTLVRWLQEESLMARGETEHARFRRLFIGALTPRAVRRMDAQIRQVVERFAAPLRDRPGEVLDLMGEFTNPIPNAV